MLNMGDSNFPEFAEWMDLSREALARRVRPYGLSVKIAMDGTARHFLLKHPTVSGQVENYAEYARLSAANLRGVIDLLFSCGFQTVMILNVWPPDVDRREDHLRRSVRASQEQIIGEAALARYRAWKARVRLFGNYDISPIMASAKSDLLAIAQELEAATPTGECLLLWGYSGGNALDEVIARTVQLYSTLGYMPSEEELRRACFPFGPEHLDVFIGGGWLRIGNADLPPVLNAGHTDIYSLSHLPLDLTEGEVRRILYDRIFRRYAGSPVADGGYTPQALEQLRNYYTQHSECLLGLGHLVAGGLWYPDHEH